MCVLCNIVYANQTLVGGASVNSLCQQGGLFALSVNKHSAVCQIMFLIYFYITISCAKQLLISNETKHDGGLSHCECTKSNRTV